jgi:hypothetical protein
MDTDTANAHINAGLDVLRATNTPVGNWPPPKTLGLKIQGRAPAAANLNGDTWDAGNYQENRWYSNAFRNIVWFNALKVPTKENK